MARRMNVPYLSVPQVAKMVKMSDSVVHRAIHNGELVPINTRKEGAKKFFARLATKDVHEWIEKNFGRPKNKVLPLLEPIAGIAPILPTGPGRLTTIDEKLDQISTKLDLLIKLWS